MGINDTKMLDWQCLYLKTRVVRAGYVVDLNVWGGVCVFWQVTLVDRGVPVGWVLWTCEREGMGKGKRGPSGQELASPAWSLGHTLCCFGNQGAGSGSLEGGGFVFLCLPTSVIHSIATCAKSEAILDKLLVRWLTGHCRSHPNPSHGYLSFQHFRCYRPAEYGTALLARFVHIAGGLL